MAFIDWLRKQHSDSLRASQRLAADPFLKGVQPGVNTAPAPRGAIPFQRTKPGFFARDYKKEDLVDNTLTMKNDGSETLVRKWKDPDQSALRVSALGDVAGSPLTLGPVERSEGAPIAGQSYPGGSYGKSLRGVLPRRDLSPEAQAAIAQVQATGGKNVDGYGNPIGPDLQNYRVMHNAMTKPNPQVVPSIFSIPQQTQRNIWGSRFVPNPAPMIRKERNAPPVGMDEEQWRFLLDRIYGGNN